MVQDKALKDRLTNKLGKLMALNGEQLLREDEEIR